MLTRHTVSALWRAAVLGALCVALFLSGCVAGPTALAPTPWPTPIVAEKPTYVVQRGRVADTFLLEGQIVPATWELLYFPVDGQLAELLVTTGSEVRQGQVLAELEMKGLTEQLAQARITLEQAEDQVAQQERARRFGVERSRLSLRLQELSLQRLRQAGAEGQPLAVVQAERELERARQSLQRAQAAYDAVAWNPAIAALPQAAALQTATLEYQLAEIRYQTQIGDREAQVKAQEVQVEMARLALKELEEATDLNLQRNLTRAQMQVQALERQLDERRLRAPHDGVVMAIGLRLEGLRRGFAREPAVGDSVPAFAPLIAVAKPAPLEIVILPDERGNERARELVVDQPVTVRHPTDRDRPFEAQVATIPVRALGGARPVGSPQIHLALPPDAPPMTLGDSVEIEVAGEVRPDTLFLAPAAIRRFMGHTFVVVQAEGKQRRIDVRVGLENEEQVEILAGLQEGEVVISP